MVEFSNYAFISIGANLPSDIGDPCDTLEFAFSQLAVLSTAPLLKSSVYITSPVGSPADTPDFYNAMAGIVPGKRETPFTFLHKLQFIENKAGRTRSGVRNEARALDLDLILFRQELIDDPVLLVPHPRTLSRKFVMQPLVEIVGREYKFPGAGRTTGDILDSIQGQDVKKLEK